VKRWEAEPPREPQSWQSVAPWRLGRARHPDPGRFQTISQLQGKEVGSDTSPTSRRQSANLGQISNSLFRLWGEGERLRTVRRVRSYCCCRSWFA
jgi:hypothetical protein